MTSLTRTRKPRLLLLFLAVAVGVVATHSLSFAGHMWVMNGVYGPVGDYPTHKVRVLAGLDLLIVALPYLILGIWSGLGYGTYQRATLTLINGAAVLLVSLVRWAEVVLGQHSHQAVAQYIGPFTYMFMPLLALVVGFAVALMRPSARPEGPKA